MNLQSQIDEQQREIERLKTELQKNTAELQTALTSVSVLYQISSQLSELDNANQASQTFVSSICRNFSIDIGVLLELDRRYDHYHAIASIGLPREVGENISGQIQGSAMGQAVKQDEPFNLTNLGQLPEFIRPFPVKTVLFVPIASKGGSRYVLLCCRLYDQEFLIEEQRVISILGSKLALTLDSLTTQRSLKETSEALAREKAGVEMQITERTKQLSEEHTRFIASVNSLKLGFMMIDAHDHVLHANPSFWSILGLTAGSLKDAHSRLSQILKLEELVAQCRTSRKPLDIDQLTFMDKYLRLYLSPVLGAGEEVIGVVLLLEDITEAMVIERSKDEFFSIASHELRTPLTAIKGNASMILDYYRETIKDPSMVEMVEDIHTSSVRLIEIVNDFLDASRLEQGKIQFKLQLFSVDKVVEQVVYEMGVMLNQKGISLKIAGDAGKALGVLPPIFADPDRTKQIIYNLVGNAAKFTEQGSITLHLQIEDGFMKIRVSDTGRGIPLEQQALLFHKFQQAGASLLTRDTTRGTGLGLYISKLLAEGMGGRIGLESSSPGEGTTFFFALPLQSATAPAPAVPTEPGRPVTGRQPSTTKPRILIFEDDPYVQRLYQRLFALEDYTVELLDNGENGLAKTKKYQPNLILLDVMMPKVNGLAVLKELRRDTATKEIPVLILTNFGEADTIDQAKQLGVSGYLIKADFSPERVLEEVKKLL